MSFTGHEIATTVTSDSVTYHHTTVFRLFDDNRIQLRSGGWKTTTTKRRINQAFAEFGIHARLYAKNYAWFVNIGNQTLPFEDGMIIEV